MKLIGFNLHKISAEKYSGNFKELKIENGLQIDAVEVVKTELFKEDEEALQIIFNYTLDYTPKLAKLSFSGSLLFLVNDKDAKRMLKEWEKRKLPDDIKMPLFNIILRKVSLRALELEDELNLPLHVNLPLLKEQKKD